MKLTGPGPVAGREGTWYFVDGKPVPRVSSLLDGISSPELARFNRGRLWQRFQAGDTYEGAVIHAERTLDALAQRGTAIHSLIELGEGGKLAEVKGAAQAVIDLFGGQVVATESSVANFTKHVGWTYAGTADLWAIDLDGRPCVADYKTGSIGQRPYLRHLLQIAAYASASHQVGLDGELVESTEFADFGIIIGLTQEGGYTAHKVDFTGEAGDMLREALSALETIWALRQMYGQGSGWAEKLEGKVTEW